MTIKQLKPTKENIVVKSGVQLTIYTIVKQNGLTYKGTVTIKQFKITNKESRILSTLDLTI